MTDRETIHECLQQMAAAPLDHTELLQVAAVCKENGLSMEEFAGWFGRSKPVNQQIMYQQWNSIKGNSNHPVGIGTLVHLCREQGGEITTGIDNNDPGYALDWDSVIGPRDKESAPVARGQDDLRIVRQEWLEQKPLPEPAKNWDGKQDFIKYLQTLFSADERVCVVTSHWEHKNGNGEVRYMPQKGVWDRTAGELIEKVSKSPDLNHVIGDWDEKVGAWIRFNPLDGNGCTDQNVTSFRYTLVESDSIPIDKQHSIYLELELPIVALVHSGGKSLHAIVKIDAPDFKEYQKRVDFLYEVCKKNGLPIDRVNRNPSRLSRLPGATRNGNRQWLVATNVGKSTWEEWREWVSAVNDDLPDVECAAQYIAAPPPLADTIIEGILRCGHKMLLSGPSKAGKSWILLQLAIAIAEGKSWMGWQCKKGRVLYVNLELDRASGYHRLKLLYERLKLMPDNACDLDVWNLRGNAMPMDTLAPRLIRRAIKRQYSAIIIDPLYKVITGDENAADQMAKFCNQFDKVCKELGAAVIYAHHHSKGDQGQKRAGDRASGSGVFARDPDALIDLIELEVTEAMRKTISNRWECDAIAAALNTAAPGWSDRCSQDEMLAAFRLAAWAIANGYEDVIHASRPAAVQAAEMASAWRIEGILREFASFKSKRLWFKYPLHLLDKDGLLLDSKASGEGTTVSRVPVKRRSAQPLKQQVKIEHVKWETEK